MSILNLTTPTPLNEVILQAAEENLTVTITAPDRKGRREVVIVCAAQAKTDRASMANGEAVPQVLGEMARYHYQAMVAVPANLQAWVELDI